jgi:hypothetical protein
MMSCTGLCRCRSSLSSAIPSTLGIMKSASTTPNESSASFSSAFWPSATLSTSKPSASRMAVSGTTDFCSSSAIRIFGFIRGLVRRTGVRSSMLTSCAVLTGQVPESAG